jgi:hypothetical protein
MVGLFFEDWRGLKENSYFSIEKQEGDGEKYYVYA